MKEAQLKIGLKWQVSLRDLVCQWPANVVSGNVLPRLEQ